MVVQKEFILKTSFGVKDILVIRTGTTLHMAFFIASLGSSTVVTGLSRKTNFMNFVRMYDTQQDNFIDVVAINKQKIIIMSKL